MISRSIDLIVVEYSARPLAQGRVLKSEWSWSGVEPDPVIFACDGVTWEFEREIVIVGLEQPVGIGDVRLWPSGEEHNRLRLASPYGVAVYEMERKPLADFALDMIRAVPKQREITDELIARYLDEWSSR